MKLLPFCIVGKMSWLVYRKIQNEECKVYSKKFLVRLSHFLTRLRLLFRKFLRFSLSNHLVSQPLHLTGNCSKWANYQDASNNTGLFTNIFIAFNRLKKSIKHLHNVHFNTTSPRPFLLFLPVLNVKPSLEGNYKQYLQILKIFFRSFLLYLHHLEFIYWGWLL